MRHLAMGIGAMALIGAASPPALHTPRIRAQCDSAGHVAPSSHIIVQGGIAPLPAIGGPARPGSDDPAALGPKQDDPGPPPAPDLHATRVGGMGDPAALGPKQDDPGPPPAPDLHASGANCLIQPGGSPR